MYHPKDIEPKWQKFWEENDTFRTLSPTEARNKPKKYVLSMFPYPSGEGLHVGHAKVYSATDAYARYCKTRGYNVLHPMGWDAFGLPAENYAIKTGTHPAVTTAKNVANYTRQMKSIGLSYDWSREINTTDPDYIKQTQWVFLQLFERGLAYEQDLPINYCPSCKTGLANEEVVGDNVCDRCGIKVERRKIRQWVLKITEYAERLLKDIDTLDWPESIKEMQRNWIGKSEGVEFRMKKVFPPIPNPFPQEEKGDSSFWNKSPEYIIELARELRKIATNTEEIMWELLRRKQLDGVKFRRQHPFGRYIADFYSDEAKLVIEIDGSVHETVSQKEYDAIRDDIIRNYGVRILRISNEDIKNNLEWVIQKILLLLSPFGGKAGIGGNNETSLSVYTTRIDTVYGMTYVVLAADHSDVASWVTPEQKSACDAYIAESKAKSDQDRTNEGKEKTGVFTGSYVVNPFNGEQIPVWIGDYVLGSYGTGAVMAVPAHDERDFAFAKKMGLKIKQSIATTHHVPDWKEEGWVYEYDKLNKLELVCTYDGALVNSAEFIGKSSNEARKLLAEKAESEGFGRKKTNYKLRDWLFSRQRYWGEPIPLIHLAIEDLKKTPHIGDISQATDPTLAYILKRDPVVGEDCKGTLCKGSGKVRELVIGGKVVSKIYDGIYGKIICDYQLPLELPEVANYEPAGDGNSPLALVPEFVNVKIAENLSGKRETNTMPQWAGSCWYYLRFMDPKFPDAPASPEMIEYWGQVDKYVGGAEHAVLHLLYARFWHKVLFDIGVVSFKEPFRDLIGVGLILGPDGGKMSKSKGNVINPDDVVKEYGADTLRMYELSISDFRDAAPWNTEAIIGVRRFIERSLAIFETPKYAADDMKAMKLMHKTIKKVGEDIEAFKFNTAISALMILLNEWLPKDSENQLEWKQNFAIMVHPFAPHLAEELYQMVASPHPNPLPEGEGETRQSPLSPLGEGSGVRAIWESIYNASWPEYHDFMLVDDEVTIAIQVNGKLRGTHVFLNGVAQEEVSARALDDREIAKWIEGKEIVREIFVPNKLLSIVVKDL